MTVQLMIVTVDNVALFRGCLVYRAVLWPMIDIMCFMDCASGCASSSQLWVCVTVSSSKCAFKSLDMNTFKRTSYSNKNKNMKRQCSFCQVTSSL